MFTYVQEMLDKGTVSAYIALGAIGIVVLLASCGALKGLHRGVARQGVRVVTIVASVFIALFVTLFINNNFIARFDGMTVSEALVEFNLADRVNAMEAPIPDIINSFDMKTLQSVVALPLGLFIAPILFVLVFTVVSGLLWIVHAVGCGMLGLSHKKNNIVTRLTGLALGAVQGAFVGVVMLVPVISLCNLMETTINQIGEPDDETETAIIEFYDENVRDAVESPIISLASKCGGNALSAKLATVKVNGEKRDVRDAIPTAISIYSAIAKLAETDYTDFNEEAKNDIHEIIDLIGEDKTISSLMAAVISGMAHSLAEGDIPIESEEPFTSLLDSLFAILETTTSDDVGGDLTTITNVLFILSDAGVLELDNAEAVDLLVEKDENGKTIIDKVISELNANERTKVLVTQLTKVTISLMMNSTAENSSADINIDEHYDEMKTGMNSIVTLKKDEFETEEEYHEAVVENLNTTLNNSGIELEEDVVDKMATYIAENHGEKEEELSDEEFNDILLNYYDAYLEYQQTGKLPPEMDQNQNGIPDTEENLD